MRMDAFSFVFQQQQKKLRIVPTSLSLFDLFFFFYAPPLGAVGMVAKQRRDCAQV